MSKKQIPLTLHPTGDSPLAPTLPNRPTPRTPAPAAAPQPANNAAPIPIDTFGGRVHVEWNPQAPVTPLGQLPFFIEFLKTAQLFEPWVQDCPLAYTSPNAPAPRDVLGTLLLSILAGNKRYAHITAMRGDGVNPALLGMNKVCSEDSVRRALEGLDPQLAEAWLRTHLRRCYEPLLYAPWIMDVDATIKTIYGRQQEGGVAGYNPHKPGRPAHCYHTAFFAKLRLELEVDVQPGNQTSSKHGAPGIFGLLDELPAAARPWLLRGDSGFGNEGVMAACEERAQPYLFKLRQTSGVRRLIEKLFGQQGQWEDAGQGWEGAASQLKLAGWSRQRRVVVLRRLLPEAAVLKVPKDQAGQLYFLELGAGDRQYEYAVLASSLEQEILTLGQLYRDRADAENGFDELKNQWGWGGFVTRDLARCRTMARMVGLVYNWWTLFGRLADPERHGEAITTRPLLLHAIGEVVRHGGQTFLRITSMHARRGEVEGLFRRLAGILRDVKTRAEQLDWAARWRLLLSLIFEKMLGGRPLPPPQPALPAPVNCRI